MTETFKAARRTTVPGRPRSSKTGKLVWIPATRELRTHLDGLDRRGALVMLTVTGKAFTKRYFEVLFR